MTAEACATCGHPESSHGIAARCIGNRNLCACRRYIAAPVTPPTDTTEADYLSGFVDETCDKHPDEPRLTYEVGDDPKPSCLYCERDEARAEADRLTGALGAIAALPSASKPVRDTVRDALLDVRHDPSATTEGGAS